MSLQNLERRFGVTAVQKGFITADQLIEALSTQVMEELEETGHRLIGQILLEKEYITAEQIKEVIAFIGISKDFISRVQQSENKAEITDADENAVIVPAVEFDSGLKQIAN